VTPIRENGSRLPFFFLHGDFDEGGLYCRNVAEVLGPEQPFVALHPHGIDGRPIPASIEAMAIDHLATVRSLQPHGPYFLGGFCNGGLVAVEMARRLEAQGERVALLAVMDASVGDTRFGAAAVRGLVERFGTWWGLTPHERLHLYTRVRRGVPELVELGGHCARRLRDLSKSDLDGWVTALRRKTRRSREMFARPFRRGRRHAAPPDAAPASPETSGPTDLLSEPLAHTYARVLAGHIPRRYAGAITLLRAGDTSAGKPDGGWRAVARNVDVHVIPGDHETSRTEHVRALSERLSACLQKAQQR
jgi:thioesterase domain-containing protein